MKGRDAIGRPRIDWPGSLRKAAMPHAGSSLDSLPSLIWRRERRRPDRLTCIVLDISGSSLSRQNHRQRTRQLEKAMALVKQIASGVYLAREQLMLMTLGGDSVTEVMPPRRAPRTIASLLDNLVPGGGTPLRRGLDEARQRLSRLQHQTPETTCLWILTDARSRDDLELTPFGCETHVVNCEPRSQSLGRARELAAALDAVCHCLDDLTGSEQTTSLPHSRRTTLPRRTP